MANPIKKKSAYEKYIRKHPFVYFFGFIQAVLLVAFIVELVTFKTFGYSPATEYFPPSNQQHTLPFWQKCGTNMPGREIPFPNLFCANDTNTYVNPFLRAVLFGVEAYAVMQGFLIGFILLVTGIAVIRDKRRNKDIGIDTSARQNLKQMAVLFVFLIAILVVIYHFA